MGSQTFVRAWEARPYRPTCDPRAPRRNSADPRGPTAERDSPFPCIGPRDASDICVNTEGTTSGSGARLASAPTGPPVAGSPICALPFFDRMRGGGRKQTDVNPLLTGSARPPPPSTWGGRRVLGKSAHNDNNSKPRNTPAEQRQRRRAGRMGAAVYITSGSSSGSPGLRGPRTARASSSS